MSMALMIIAISAMNIIVVVVINTIYTFTVIVSKGNDENTFQGRYSLAWRRISLMQHNTEEDL